MLRAIEWVAAGAWPEAEAVDSVTLDYDSRHRRRLRLASDRGQDLLLDLPKAVAMTGGDGLRLEDGGWLAVHAAPEAVIEVTCAGPDHLARVAWHLGNRHLPVQVNARRLLIRPDHVIESMLRGLDASTRPLQAPFDPEPGAYVDRGHHANPPEAGHEH